MPNVVMEDYACSKESLCIRWDLIKDKKSSSIDGAVGIKGDIYVHIHTCTHKHILNQCLFCLPFWPSIISGFNPSSLRKRAWHEHKVTGICILSLLDTHIEINMTQV